jgi:two-component system invasion response regulator UvrY
LLSARKSISLGRYIPVPEIEVTLQPTKKIKVVLADDHPMTMAGFSSTLLKYGIEVIGTARTPAEAEEMYAAMSPDVLVLDVRFGEKLTGMDVAKRVLGRYPNAAIVFLSQFDQDSLIKDAYRVGGRAFVTKDREPADVAQAIQHADRGELFILPHIADRLAKLSVRGDNSPRSVLNESEIELFVLLARGLTIPEMADELKVSGRTISNLSHSVKVKLGLTRSADITRLAVKHGFIEP